MLPYGRMELLMAEDRAFCCRSRMTGSAEAGGRREDFCSASNEWLLPCGKSGSSGLASDGASGEFSSLCPLCVVLCCICVGLKESWLFYFVYVYICVS